jgi:hypothetical protein
MRYTFADLQHAAEFLAQAEDHVRQRESLIEGLDKDSLGAKAAAAELPAYRFALQEHRRRHDQIRDSLTRSQLECELDLSERLIANGQRYLSEQKLAIEQLTATGKPTSEAQVLLATYEFALEQNLRQRDQLRRRQSETPVATPSSSTAPSIPVSTTKPVTEQQRTAEGRAPSGAMLPSLEEVKSELANYPPRDNIA